MRRCLQASKDCRMQLIGSSSRKSEGDRQLCLLLLLQQLQSVCCQTFCKSLPAVHPLLLSLLLEVMAVGHQQQL